MKLPEEYQKKAEFYQKAYEDANGDLMALKGSGAMPFFRYKKFVEERLMSSDEVPLHTYLEILEQSRSDKLKLRSEPVADWKSIGPNKMHVYGGRMISHAFHPTDPATFYAGSATGGLWKTTDTGDSWRSMTDDIPNTGVGGIAVNPHSPEELVIGTGEGYFIGTTVRPGIGMFKSVNGGETWVPTSFQFPVSQGVSVLKMAWDPINESNVYAAATNGLWVSRDGGDTWFVKLSNGIADDVVVNPKDPSKVYTVIENDGVYKSTDFGESWNRLNNGLPAIGVINFGRIALCAAEPDVLYTSLTDQATLGLEGLYKTTDGGNTWEKLVSTPNAFCPPPPFNYGCQGFYDNAVGVSPFDPDLVMIGGITFWRSSNGGRSWTQHDTYAQPNRRAPPGKTFVDHHDIGFSPHDSSVVWSLSDGGVALSLDGGKWFDQKNEGILIAQFYDIASSLTDPSVFIGGMQDHGLQATDLNVLEDNRWKKWGDLDGGDVAISTLNENIFYGTWIDGQYLKTLNGIGNWQTYFINQGIDRNENITGYFNPMVMHPTDPNRLVTATPQSIYRTTNGGSWVREAAISGVKELAFDHKDPSIIYAASYSISAGTWGFWRSENFGKDWSATLTSPGWRVTDIITNPKVSKELYVCRNSAFAGTPHIYKSVDGGDQWKSIQGDLPDITVNDLAINHHDPNILYAGTDLGVYVTIDGGQHWSQYSEGMPIAICYSLHYNPTDSTLVVGTIGRAAWKTKSGPNLVLNTVSNALEGQCIVFPNPGASNMTVQFSGLDPGDYQLSLISTLGRMIKEETIKINNEIYSIESLSDWTRCGIPSGSYYLALRKNHQQLTNKIIVK